MNILNEVDAGSLMERMRCINHSSIDNRGTEYIRTYYLEVEAVGDQYWVIRYGGLHSVVGNEGLYKALIAMCQYLQSIKIYL